MHRSYIGTHIYDSPHVWRRPYLSNRAELTAQLSENQLNWLERVAPDWNYWRDEFRRRHYHIYSRVLISDNNLTLASLLFYQERPSTVPLGEEHLWAGVFKD